jgi:hypothetical protein
MATRAESFLPVIRILPYRCSLISIWFTLRTISLTNYRQLKKTPFFSRPSTDTMFAAGSAGLSD